MDVTTGRFALPEKAYYSALVFLFILAGAVSFFYVRSEQKQEEDHLLRSLGVELRDLLILHLTDDADEDIYNNPAIMGFGIYDIEGSNLYTYLDAPKSLDISEGLDESVWDFDNGTVTYVEFTSALFRYKPLEEVPFFNSDLLKYSNMQHILYIHSKLPRGFRQQRIRQSVFVSLIISALGAAIFFLRHSFIRYRRLQAEYESKERLIVLGTAARTLTHEMKNPLGVISLQTALLRRQNTADPPELVIIDEEVFRLSSLMDDTRYYLGDDLGDPHIIDIFGFTERMRSRLSPMIKWRIPSGVAPVLIDEDRMRSILENLVMNALDSGSAEEGILVKMESLGGKVTLSVNDHGCGMSDSVLKRSQDPFFTTKSRGMGLGLHLVSRFVSAAGGQLRVDSVQGEGTNVKVMFPGVHA